MNELLHVAPTAWAEEESGEDLQKNFKTSILRVSSERERMCSETNGGKFSLSPQVCSCSIRRTKPTSN